MKARFPGYLPEQVMQRVRVTSDNIDALLPAPRKGKMGYGRVNASRALLVQTPAISVTLLMADFISRHWEEGRSANSMKSSSGKISARSTRS